MRTKCLIYLMVLLMIISTGIVFSGCKVKTEETTEKTIEEVKEAVEETTEESTETTVAEPKYKIALSNAYMGNDWRQIMIKTVKAVAAKDPYKDRVELMVVNSDNTPEAQAASIDVLIQQGYDAILIDAASATALSPVLERALEAGIVCVSFDSIAQHEGVYQVSTDFVALSTAWANYLVEMMGGGQGKKVAVDTGLPGYKNGNIIYETAEKVLLDNGVNIIAEFAGEWADGVGQQQIGSVLAANPELDGMFSQVYGETILAAFNEAGRDFIPCTAFDTNAGMLAVVDNNMPVIIGNNVPGLSAIAMSIAVKVLDGEEVDQITLITPGQFVMDTSIDVGYPTVKIEKDVNCFEGLPGALDWPVLPADFVPQVTIDEISDYQQ